MLTHESKTYPWDYDIFVKLGLPNFIIKDQDKHLLGVYKHPDYEDAFVEISVTCMPAQFWHFKIITAEDQMYNVDTGSGSLSEYWPSIELILQGMLVIEKVN